KRIVWQDTGLRGPDDAFFTPGFRTIITNEEFNDTLTEVSLRSRARIWRYGHDAVPGSSPGYLNTPDDAYRLANGVTTIADIRNCRIVELTHSKRLLHIWGGSCVHDPPNGFASPNGDTPLPDGGLLVTEIGPPGWIDRLAADGHLVWSVESPIAYPSDAQLLPNGHILVSGFTHPGKIIEMTRTGHITWSFGDASGRNELNKPSLAVRLPNGLIASNDDWNERVILTDPPTHDTAAALRGGAVILYGGGETVSVPTVVRIDPASGRTTTLHALDEPLSDLGAANIGATTYLVGGYTGTRYASAILRVGANDRTTTITRLPYGLRYAGVAAFNDRIYVAGGIDPHGTPTAILILQPQSHALRQIGPLPH